MNDLETMKRAKSYIDMLANGIDPLTGETIRDDSVINNVRISRCLFYVSDVLKRAIDNDGEFGKKYTHALRPFSITPEQAEKITISEDPVPVSILKTDILPKKFRAKKSAGFQQQKASQPVSKPWIP